MTKQSKNYGAIALSNLGHPTHTHWREKYEEEEYSPLNEPPNLGEDDYSPISGPRHERVDTGSDISTTPAQLDDKRSLLNYSEVVSLWFRDKGNASDQKWLQRMTTFMAMLTYGSIYVVWMGPASLSKPITDECNLSKVGYSLLFSIPLFLAAPAPILLNSVAEKLGNNNWLLLSFSTLLSGHMLFIFGLWSKQFGLILAGRIISGIMLPCCESTIYSILGTMFRESGDLVTPMCNARAGYYMLLYIMRITVPLVFGASDSIILSMVYTGLIGLTALSVLLFWIWQVKKSSFPAFSREYATYGTLGGLRFMTFDGWVYYISEGLAGGYILTFWVFAVDILVDAHGYSVTQANFIFSFNHASAFTLGVLLCFLIKKSGWLTESWVIIYIIFYPVGIMMIYKGQSLPVIISGIALVAMCTDIFGNSFLGFLEYTPRSSGGLASTIVTSIIFTSNSLSTVSTAAITGKYSWSGASAFLCVLFLIPLSGAIYIRIFGKRERLKEREKNVIEAVENPGGARITVTDPEHDPDQYTPLLIAA